MVLLERLIRFRRSESETEKRKDGIGGVVSWQAFVDARDSGVGAN